MDVLVTRASGSPVQEKTMAIVEDALVIAVRPETKSNPQRKGLIVQVALLLSSDDAQKLIAAGGHVRLQLSK